MSEADIKSAKDASEKDKGCKATRPQGRSVFAIGSYPVLMM